MDKIAGFLVRIMVWLAQFAPFLSKLGWCHYDKWTPGKVHKILLVGYNGARNTGADVRVAVIVNQLEQLLGKENIEISVMTLHKEKSAAYFAAHIKQITFHPIFFWDVYKACSGCHAALLCEGSALKSKFANALTMYFCEAAGIMAKQDKPCLAYGAEAGEMDRFMEQLAQTMCRKTFFIARTKESQQRIRQLGLGKAAAGRQNNSGVVLGTDPAWLFSSSQYQDPVDSLLRKKGWDGKKPILGIAPINPFCWPVQPSLSKWIKGLLTRKWQRHYSKWYFFSWSPQRKEKFEAYLDAIAAAVNRYCAKHEVFPVLIGMEALDQEAVLRLRQRLTVKPPIFLSRDYDGFILAQLLRSLHILITSRYHAKVLAMGNQVPSISISMDERLDNLIKELGFEAEFLHHVEEAELEQKIVLSLQKIEQHRIVIKTKLSQCLPKYCQKVDQMGLLMRKYLHI